jgi:hypothetical protein
MEPKSRRISNVTSGVAAVAAFFTQPVPMLDELIVAPIHYALILRMATARRFNPLRLPWKNLHRIIWYGAAARLVSHLGLGLIPFLGAFANSITAIALTEYLARYLDEAIANPDKPAPEISMQGLKDLFTRAVAMATEDKRAQKAPEGGGAAAAAPASAPPAAEAKPPSATNGSAPAGAPEATPAPAATRTQ